MDRNTSILKSIKEDFSYQIAKAIMKPFDRNNIELSYFPNPTSLQTIRVHLTLYLVPYQSLSIKLLKIGMVCHE